MTGRNVALRWGPWCGIVVPGLDTLVNGLVAAAQTEYSPLRDYISELSASDVPYAGLIRGWWIAFPFLFTPFVLAVRAGVGPRKAGWAPAALLELFALALAGCGVFHCDPGCQGKTFSAHAHFISSGIAAAALFLSPPALAWVVWDDERWRRQRWIDVAWLLLGVAAGAALFVASLGFLPYRGLCERLFYGVYYLWVILVALHLLRLRHRPAAPA